MKRTQTRLSTKSTMKEGKLLTDYTDEYERVMGETSHLKLRFEARTCHYL
jgi:hypothetical protein